MRALTVRQPWAWAIVHGGKDVENRVRPLGPYRGPVAIHASQRIADSAAWTDRNVQAAMVQADSLPAWSTTLGTVVGVVDLVDSHHRDECLTRPGGWCSTWAMPDHHHLVMTNPRPLGRPFQASGRLGLWIPEPYLVQRITDELQEVA
jgi:hypothetical protein